MHDLKQIRAMMDKRYADGTAYKTSLPFDRQRGERIRTATLALAESLWSPIPRTLDIGCGEGGIASFWPHQNIVGVELSEVAVQKARKSFPDVDYRVSAIEDFRLTPEEEPFELVVAQESIEHWVDVDAGLAAIRACMAPGGGLVLTTPNRDSLHCRISRKLGIGEAPICSIDHVHEFRYQELIDRVTGAGFEHQRSAGVGLLPYWSMERVVGEEVRRLTDHDEEVNQWFNDIASFAPAEYAFIQCHAFRKVIG